jgi:hypothetical protein
MALDERALFTEKPETRRGWYQCPKCLRTGEYSIWWVRRSKKDRLPAGAHEGDRAKFARLRDYLLRLDDDHGRINFYSTSTDRRPTGSPYEWDTLVETQDATRVVLSTSAGAGGHRSGVVKGLVAPGPRARARVQRYGKRPRRR